MQKTSRASRAFFLSSVVGWGLDVGDRSRTANADREPGERLAETIRIVGHVAYRNDDAGDGVPEQVRTGALGGVREGLRFGHGVPFLHIDIKYTVVKKSQSAPAMAMHPNPAMKPPVAVRAVPSTAIWLRTGA